MRADVGVHPEQLLQNNDRGSRHGFRSCYIDRERAVMSCYRDVILHRVLLIGRCSSGPPPMSSSGSAEAHYRARRVQPAACMAAAEVAASSISFTVSLG